jgi:xylulokinase
MYCYSKPFTKQTTQPLYVTGGAAASREIIRRISGIWDRPVIRLEGMDTSTGAGVAGVCAYFKYLDQAFEVEKFASSLLKTGAEFARIPEDVAVFHRSGGFLDKFMCDEEKLMAAHPLG